MLMMCTQKEEIEMCSLESLVEHLQGLGGLDGLAALGGRIASERRFFLRWDHFQSNILSNFEILREQEEFVDVTLTSAEGKLLKAHRLLLSACSTYFRDIFRELPSHYHPIIVLQDTSFEELKSLLHFIYHGEVSVAQERLGLLLKAAEALRIKGLTRVKKPRENHKFGSQSASLETKSESGLDEGLSISPGSPALDLVEFTGVTGLPTSSPDSPLVPLESPSNKLQPSPHPLCSSPPAKRRRYKSVSSPLDDRIVNPISTKQREPLDSSLDEDCSIIKLITGNNGGHSLPSKSNLVIKMELQEDGEGVDDIMKRDGNDGVMGRSDHEAFLKEEEVIDDEDPLNTTLEDLSSLPPHLTANMQKLVSYAADATSAEDNFSQLDNCTEPPDDQLLHQLEITTRSHHYMHWPSRHPAVCPGCGKFFKFKYNMKIHLRKCTDVQMSSQMIDGLSDDCMEEIFPHCQPLKS